MSSLSLLLSALSGVRHDLICVAAVNINKDYLLRLANNDLSVFNQHKSVVAKVLEDAHIAVPENDRAKLTNLLLKFSLTEGLPENTATFIHDILTDNKLQIIWKLDSDSTRADFESLIAKYNRDRVVRSGEGLSESEAELWNRVKTFHEFEDGWKWVVAVDGHGEPVGFIHSDVTFKTMKHCGNKPSVNEGDVYYGLRDPQGKEHVTVILDADGKIKESKGYNNAPPKNKAEINPYMQWLMMHPMVKGVSYHRGYARHMNYGVSQMIDDSKFIAKVKKEKPELIHSGVDKIILQWKNWIAKGKKTKEELLDFYFNRKKIEAIMLEHVIGILGQFPFTEEQTVDLIKRGFLSGIEIANAGTQYLTPVIQDALMDKSTPTREQNAHSLLQVYVDVPRSKIDIFKLITMRYYASTVISKVIDQAPQRLLEMAVDIVKNKDFVPRLQNKNGDLFSRDVYYAVAYVAPAVTEYANRFGQEETQYLYDQCLVESNYRYTGRKPGPGNNIPSYTDLFNAYAKAGVDVTGKNVEGLNAFLARVRYGNSLSENVWSFIINNEGFKKQSEEYKKGLFNYAINTKEVNLVRALIEAKHITDSELNTSSGNELNPIISAIDRFDARKSAQSINIIEVLAKSHRIKFAPELFTKNRYWTPAWLIATPILYKYNRIDISKINATKVVLYIMLNDTPSAVLSSLCVNAISQLIDLSLIDPTVTDGTNKKQTLAHIAVKSRLPDFLMLLVNNFNIDFNAPDASGVSAKELAESSNYHALYNEDNEMLDIIKEYEAHKN